MSMKERRRLAIFGQVKAGQLIVASAGRVLGLSERQTRRLWKRYKSDGNLGLVHRLRGQSGNRRIDPHKRVQAIATTTNRFGDWLRCVCLHGWGSFPALSPASVGLHRIALGRPTSLHQLRRRVA